MRVSTRDSQYRGKNVTGNSLPSTYQVIDDRGIQKLETQRYQDLVQNYQKYIQNRKSSTPDNVGGGLNQPKNPNYPQLGQD